MDMRNFYRRNLPVLLVLGIILALAGAGAAKQAAALLAGSWGLRTGCKGVSEQGRQQCQHQKKREKSFPVHMYRFLSGELLLILP